MNLRQRAVIEALLPPKSCAALPWSAFDVGFDDFYAALEKTAPLSLRVGFQAALFVAGWISPLMIGRLPPLQRLSPDDRERALEALARSRFYVLRQMLLVLKVVVGLCYGGDARVRGALGVPK